MRESNTSNKRKALVAVGIFAVLLVAFFIIKNLPPSDKDVGGTIGGVEKADKYRSEQISEEDIVLEDAEIQAILQSDEFQKLIRDEQFQD